MIVDLLRHGTTGRDGFLDGRTDLALSADGWGQMERQTAGGRWRSVVASPLRRAHDPALRYATETGCRFRVDAAWAEIDFGAWDGQLRSEIPAAHLRAYHADPGQFGPPGGEAWRDFEARIGSALANLMHDADPVLVVSHAGAIRMALSLSCGIGFDRLWALRIACGTRVRVALGQGADGRLWGEIVEVAQP